jgi:hypothetical protein
MSDGDIERIMKLAFCSEEDARNAYAKTHDIIDAVDLLFTIPPARGDPKEKVVSEQQKQFTEIRKTMESIDNSIIRGFTNSNQPVPSSQVLSHNLDPVQEEMTLRSDCIQSSQIPTQESKEQKQETACQ